MEHLRGESRLDAALGARLDSLVKEGWEIWDRFDRAGVFRAPQIALAIVDAGFVRDALVTFVWAPCDRRPSHIGIFVDGRSFNAAHAARWRRRYDPC